jgi:hypothetical protein
MSFEPRLILPLPELPRAAPRTAPFQAAAPNAGDPVWRGVKLFAAGILVAGVFAGLVISPLLPNTRAANADALTAPASPDDVSLPTLHTEEPPSVLASGPSLAASALISVPVDPFTPTQEEVSLAPLSAAAPAPLSAAAPAPRRGGWLGAPLPDVHAPQFPPLLVAPRVPTLQKPAAAADKREAPSARPGTPAPTAALAPTAAPAPVERPTLTGIIQGDPPLVIVRYEGQTLFLKVGDRAGTAWKLEEIRESSAVFRMGDQRVEVLVQGGISR